MSLLALKEGYQLHEYRIEKLLGEGGFGLTYLAFDTNLEKWVAIKEYMPREHAVRNDDSKIIASSDTSKKVYDWGLNAFLNEAKTLAKYEDTNIVRIYRFFKANGTAYIVMEYCEGGCLIDRVSKNSSMDEQVLKSIINAIANGLKLVHNDGILHRDIKPDNIMFRSDDTPVLIDFGAARLAIGSKSRKVTTIITPGYAPLEQYSSSGDIGPWSDIYSLAAVAYLCITGKRPANIMNRLHDDTVIKLGDKPGASAFLKAIDAGLEVQIEDRPKDLTEWTAMWQNNWQEPATELSDSATAPIYAKKYTGVHKKLVIPQPISARPISGRAVSGQPISQADEMTILRDDESSSKWWLYLIVLPIIAVGGYFAYQNYLKDKLQPYFNTVLNKAKTNTQIKQPIAKPLKPQQDKPNIVVNNSQSVLTAQQLLNQLGYTVSEDGILTPRTIESIKAFEKSQNLVVTGAVDSILINKLQQSLLNIDENDWQQAQSINSVESYNQYLTKHIDGKHISDAMQSIQDIKIKLENDIQDMLAKKKAEQIELAKKKARAEALALEQKAQQAQQIKQIALEKKALIRDIQTQFQRLKFKDIAMNGKMSKPLKKKIIAYQKLKKMEATGLPTSALLFQLKSEQKWPGHLLGEEFQDCPICPAMIVIPAGSYMMGSIKGKANELPRHNVDIEEFILSKAEITFKQWDACVEDGVCSHKPDDEGLGRGDVAIFGVNYQDIQQFLKWLNNITKKQYRLPTEAEWEYAARAGATTEYSWGDNMGNNHASCLGCNTAADTKKINHIKNYPANAYGVFDMHGNVWEWTQDCWHPNYYGAPSDGQAWEPNGCNKYVVRGGSGGNKPEDLRAASRGAIKADQRLNSVGFRVALDSN